MNSIQMQLGNALDEKLKFEERCKKMKKEHEESVSSMEALYSQRLEEKIEEVRILEGKLKAAASPAKVDSATSNEIEELLKISNGVKSETILSESGEMVKAQIQDFLSLREKIHSFFGESSPLKEMETMVS